MGLLQKAYETFENFEHLAGKEREGHATLAPVGHEMRNANIEITIDNDGKFISARVLDKKGEPILMPMTEASSAKTNNMVPNPLCEKLDYILPSNQEYLDEYLQQMTEWTESEYTHEMLKAIITYLSGGTLFNDMLETDVIKMKDGKPESPKQCVIRWVVNGVSGNSCCWKNEELQQKWAAYYLEQKEAEEHGLDMITGEVMALATQFPKGLNPNYPNAKLVTANDTTSHTFLGEFLKSARQAIQLGYLSLQKAHAALKWVIAEQGIILDTRTFVCWSTKQKEVINPVRSLRKNSSETAPVAPGDYKKALREAVYGYKTNMPEGDNIVVAILNVIDKGNNVQEYYNSWNADDYFQRLIKWDEECCWVNGIFGVQSPSLNDIVRVAFGYIENGLFKINQKEEKIHLKPLVLSKMNQTPISASIKTKLVQNANHLTAYIGDSTAPNAWRKVLFTACAVLRKYYLDVKKEEYSMEVEKDKRDISYQYGRLLAVYDKIERDAKLAKDKQVRTTNALQLQSNFVLRSSRISAQLEEKMNQAYLPNLKYGQQVRYRKLITEIRGIIAEFPDVEWKRKLDDTYLFGFSAQMNDFYKKKDTEDEDKKEEE